MASWIGASPSQRFWQYIVPAARRSIANGEWDKCIAEYDAQIEAARSRVEAAEPGTTEHRIHARRLAKLETERARTIESRQHDLDILAEADRRQALRRAHPRG